MKDVLGQEIKVGSKVLWANMKYAGFAGGPLEVLKVNEKKITVSAPHPWRTGEMRKSAVWPDDVVVVDKILEAQA